MKKIIFCIIISLLNLAGCALHRNDFPPDLQKVLDERTDELKTNGGIFIAGRVKMNDGTQISGGKDVMVNLIHNFDEPLWVYKNGLFMMGRTFSSNYAGDNGKLALRAFGYEPDDIPITILKGEITYLEFEMRKIPPDKLAAVKGIVMNDRNEPIEGAKVNISFPFANHGYRGDTGYSYPHKEMTTGKEGLFSFEGLPPTKHSLVASASGCAYHSVELKPSAGEVVNQDLKLYPNQKIIIDYVYQEDGNSTFGGGEFQTGTIEWTNGEGGVDFSDGRVEGYDPSSLRDIEMIQDQNNLKFGIFYCNGRNGFYDRGDVDFESVTKAAKAGYDTRQKPCVIGHTYIVRTYEDKYAKFVIRSISKSQTR